MNKKPPHLQWLHRLPQDLLKALRKLPEPLQDAIHDAVAACKPQSAPRLYAGDWLEELYQEAIVAAWNAQQHYNPHAGCSLYRWGLRLIGQRLQAFCDEVWAAARHECAYPCDEETEEEVEFPDARASEQMEEELLVSEVRAALHELGGLDEQIGLWYLFEELSEREIAKRLSISQQAVSKRLKGIFVHVRRHMGVESAEGTGKKERKRGKRG